ncbi:MAG: outer membrane protein assembly factor BamA [Verrucomicrobiales bacterium]|nr:outer membrane protein assembly factor BamA [Verrucomicrobiales bacterium]|tara:strand:+ start:3941 stop:6268 length:2328 start_codon:yes stop_codon:yes gene_type:complete
MIKLLLRRYSILLALLIFWAPQYGYAQPAPVVQAIEVKHVGPEAVSDELIRANIRVKVGDPLSTPSVNDDVRNLYGTGFFYNIRVAQERLTSGVKLIYVVQGKPLLTDIRIEGNKKWSDRKIKKKITSEVGEPLDERKLFADAQAIKEMYQKSGYQKTEVKYDPAIIEKSGRSTVTFQIVEAPKVKIERVDFVGAQAFSQKKLRKVIKTRNRWAFSWLTGSGILKDDQFEDDKERLKEYYRNEGYIDFAISDITFEYPEEKKMVIKFHVFEGQQYKVGRVSYTGNKLFPTEQVTEGVTMTTGETFTPVALQDDTDTVRDFYDARGYIDSRIEARRTPNVDTGNIDLDWQISEGDKSYVEKIEIRGNTKTKDKVIRRELAISPGEIFDMVSVRLSKERLEGLNYFEKVDSEPEETEVPNRKNLVINVEERNTGNISMGAGFSTIDNLVGFVEVTQGNFDIFNPPNFTGGGQKARMRATVGSRRQDYLISFVEPWLFDRKLAFSVDLYHRETSFRSTLYNEQQTGGSLGLERALWNDFWRGRVSYTFENVGITDVSENASPELRAESGTQLVSKIGAGLTYDTRRGGLVPNAGQKVELITEFAGLGGEADFIRTEMRGSQYFPGFAEGHTWEILGRLGTIQGYSGHNVRLFNRYFLGGPRTLRGYRFARVSPRDSIGEAFGGNTYWFGSAEYSIPIIERLRLAAFYDAGNVYSSAWSFNPNSSRGEQFYQDNVGVGVRLNIPNLGPLRLDYGFPINHDNNNSGRGRFNFDIGFTRDF